ncbi:MAG: hypothetical protein MAG794_00719 [Gammaproteobacteria bacterium]|nr:hypothetical protein [Gammaproteobacteria bacterium]
MEQFEALAHSESIYMLEELGPSLYVVEGPTVSFYGFPYPTRMAVAHLSDGGVWVWSPVFFGCIFRCLERGMAP